MNKENDEEVFMKLKFIFEKDSYLGNSDISYNSEKEEFDYKTGNLLLQVIESCSLDKRLLNEVSFKIGSYAFEFRAYRLFFYVSFMQGDIVKFIKSYNAYYDHDLTCGNMIMSKPREQFLTFFTEHVYIFLPYFGILELGYFFDTLNKEVRSLSIPENEHWDIVMKIMTDYQFEEIGKKMSGINIEINRDKEEIKEITKEYGFDGKYNKFLTILDKHFYSENKDSIEIAGMIATFRQFSNEFIVDIGIKIAALKEYDISKEEAKTPIGNSVSYLGKVMNMSKDEKKFLKSFVGILHQEGGHAFLSSIEYFRLTKNITIEIILMLLYKLKEVEKSGI